jgi:hypothetical protein
MRVQVAACLLACLGVAAATTVGAAPRHGGLDRSPDRGPGFVPADAWWDAGAAVRAGGMSLDAAVAMVQRRYNAKVVRAEESREGDDVVYRIRCLSPDGRVFTVRVNARTGQMD